MGGEQEEKSSRSPRERRSHSRDEYRSRKRDRRSRSRDRKKRKKHRSSSRSRRSSRRRSRSRSRSRRRRKHHRSRSKSEEKSSKPAPLSSVLPTLSEAPSIAQMMQMNPSCSLQEVMSKVQMNRNYSIPDVDAADDEEIPMSTAQLKASKELYIANIHPSVQSQQLEDFIGNIIQQVGLIGTPGNPIVSTWMSPEGNYAFCEFRTAEECTLALMLNGLSLMGQQLTCGRPKTYAGPAVRMPNITARTSTSLANLGCTTNLQWFTKGGAHSAPLPRNLLLPTSAKRPTVLRMPEKATPNSILMTNLPTNLDSDQVEELVRPFGPVRFFILLEDECGESTGRAVFEFVDVSLVDAVVQGLNGLEISGEKIQVKRAPVKEKMKEILPTRVLRLSNMVSLEELQDDEEYQDIKDDVLEECEKYGPIRQIVIPRGTTEGLLQVFIEFESVESCKTAMKRCNGRTFGSNTISAVYYDETKFTMNQLQ